MKNWIGLIRKTTAKYHIHNWSEYNKALIQRGSLTFWFSPEAIEEWLGEKEGKRGRPNVYPTNCYQAPYKEGIEPVIPPQRNGVLHNDIDHKQPNIRNMGSFMID